MRPAFSQGEAEEQASKTAPPAPRMSMAGCGVRVANGVSLTVIGSDTGPHFGGLQVAEQEPNPFSTQDAPETWSAQGWVRTHVGNRWVARVPPRPGPSATHPASPFLRDTDRWRVNVRAAFLNLTLL